MTPSQRAKERVVDTAMEWYSQRYGHKAATLGGKVIDSTPPAWKPLRDLMRACAALSRKRGRKRG